MAGLAHFGFGFVFKRFLPKLHIVLLLVCSVFLDLLSVILMVFGIDNIYITHSLFAALGWSVFSFVLLYIIKKDLKVSLILALLVFSHWILDVITWPMKPVYPDSVGIPVLFNDSSIIGLGLYRTVIGAILGEVLFLGIGIVSYVWMKRKQSI